ncbi:hypothetical protein B0H16DRAFT_1792984 [Mycena metata]|uniref:Uncharacterized protein n=1 Tax=Mycena metata TaxID=1033252 RepID=A0AAD7NM79_9AGAR|nr:hypothetical protein B0H16DRAFT_1792984 [Mycena metata]
MKTELSPDHPMDNAMDTLALGFEQFRRAFVQFRDELSPASIALAASEAKCRALEVKVASLEDTVIKHTETIAAANTRFAQLETRVKGERVALEKERKQLKVGQKQLAKEMVKLRKDQALVDAAQTKLLVDKRAVVTNLKRSVAEMEPGLEEQERALKKRKSDTTASTSAKVAAKEVPAVSVTAVESTRTSKALVNSNLKTPRTITYTIHDDIDCGGYVSTLLLLDHPISRHRFLITLTLSPVDFHILLLALLALSLSRFLSFFLLSTSDIILPSVKFHPCDWDATS